MSGGTRCSDEVKIASVIKPHFDGVGAYDIAYTATTAAEPKSIILHRKLLLAIREELHPHGAIVQSSLRDALVVVAVDKESVWHLGSADNQWQWADDTAKMIRTMSRHTVRIKFAQPSPC